MTCTPDLPTALAVPLPGKRCAPRSREQGLVPICCLCGSRLPRWARVHVLSREAKLPRVPHVETSLADVAFNSIQVPLPVMDPVFTRETWVMRIVACSCTYLLTYMYMSMLISLLAGIFLRACCCVCMHRQRLLCLSLMLSPYSPCVLLRVHAQTTFAVPQPHALSIHGCCQQHLCSRTPAGLQVAHQRR